MNENQGSFYDSYTRNTLIGAKGFTQANIDVFFCRSLTGFHQGHMGVSLVPSTWILLSDGSGSNAGSAISHEAGHALGLNHIVELDAHRQIPPGWQQYSGNLMFPIEGGTYLWTDTTNPRNENQSLEAYNTASALP